MSLVLWASILAPSVATPPPASTAPAVHQDARQLAGGAAGAPQGKHPAALDRTGVPWAEGFPQALERARAEERLLFLMPDSCGPSENGGWTQECFRAGPLSDERIAGLLQVRFVPCYFNTFEGTAAFDAQGLEFVARVRPEFAKEEQSFVGGMPLLVMTPAGELAGEVSPYMPADEVLGELLRFLKKNPAFDKPSAAEKSVTEPLEKARLAFARQDVDGAEALLKMETSPAAVRLRAKLARLSGDWKKQEKLLKDLEKAGLEEDAALERAFFLCHEQEFEEALEVLAAVGEAGERGDEARYLRGVALFRAERRDEALATWKALIQGRPQGPWIYRADWAYVNVLSGDAGAISGSYDGPCPSLLGRAFYVGPKNPDLGL